VRFRLTRVRARHSANSGERPFSARSSISLVRLGRDERDLILRLSELQARLVNGLQVSPKRRCPHLPDALPPDSALPCHRVQSSSSPAMRFPPVERRCAAELIERRTKSARVKNGSAEKRSASIKVGAFHLIGTESGAPLSFTKNTMNLAGFELLAFRETV
jgi:hypothetical protein